jgi:hypothetical protein
MLWQEWSQQGLNAMGKLAADLIFEILPGAGVKHCHGVVGEPAIGMALYSARVVVHDRGGDVWKMAKENFL